MDEKLLQLIRDEDKKNPLNDLQLAKKLLLNRSSITILRDKLGIPDSRNRRKPLLLSELKKILSATLNLSINQITDQVNKSGFQISKNSIIRLIKEFESELKPARVLQTKELQNSREDESLTDDPFSVMIGWDRSLRVIFEQAKAAVLYPPNGLHTLIVGATGSGKSLLAESMSKFAMKTKNITSERFPFVVFNCADYSENPQLLLAQLFGYKKGAFTGADADRDGLVADADGGILFLDEVHRLPPDGQEILFQIIDKGLYRRLGETSSLHKARIMIIAATTEDIETSLLITFRRRIPMIIEIPPLEERPIDEKYDIIKTFFQKEAVRINRAIMVTPSVLRTLLAYQCLGNIGQLRSDIQVACARGLLSYVVGGTGQDSVKVDIDSLPTHVVKGMLNSNRNRLYIERLINEDLYFFPDNMWAEKYEDKESLYNFPDEIYKDIEKDYKKFKKQGLSEEVINRIIGENLEQKVKTIFKHVKKNKHHFITKDLRTIVGEQVVEMVQAMMKIAQNTLGGIDDTLFYCLATHLKASVERIKSGKKITNPQLDYIKNQYAAEFEIARRMSALTISHLGLELPEEEIGFIAMYIGTLARKDFHETGPIGVVVITHGHVAEGMANVANRLLAINHVKAVEMSLDENLEIAYERALDAVIQADCGKGVLILVDMGSLEGFGSSISKNTGIKTRTISRVDTLMIIEAARKSVMPCTDLTDVANSLISTKNAYPAIREEYYPIMSDEMAVISLCLTGDGTAKQIHNMIKEEIDKIDKKIKIITMAAIDEESVYEQIDKLSMSILAIIGTISIKYPGIPFLASTDVLKKGGLARLMHIVRERYKEKTLKTKPKRIKDRTDSLFTEDLILINKNIRDKYEAIKFMSQIMIEKGYVVTQYLQGVLEREELCPTSTENLLAIPHGYCEDVVKPVIGVLIPQKPIDWGNGREISLVLLLALNEDSKDEFQWIYKIINNRYLVERLKTARDPKEIIQIFSNQEVCTGEE